VQVKLVDGVTSVDGMEINGIMIVSRMICRHGGYSPVILVMYRVLVVVRPYELLKLTDGESRVLMVVRVNMQV
jgi:hypothetical protein